MPEKPESQPVAGHVVAVIRDVAAPLLARAAKEIGHPLLAQVEIFKNGECVGHADELTTPGSNPARGVLRIRFREVYDPNRRLFHLDSRFPPDDRAPAFTGLACRGAVSETSDGPHATYTSWLIKREDPNWHPWL